MFSEPTPLASRHRLYAESCGNCTASVGLLRWEAASIGNMLVPPGTIKFGGSLSPNEGNLVGAEARAPLAMGSQPPDEFFGHVSL
jgi:hypothetical protein